MNLLQNAIKSSSNRLILNRRPYQELRSLLTGSPSIHQFSTEASPPTNQSFSSTKPLFETPSSDFVYGKVFGITKNTLKSDILSLLEESNLNMGDLKVDYSRSYEPIAMLVQFPSRNAYDAAIRAVTRKGRLYRLEMANRGNWDYVQPYDGKFALLQGLPPNAVPDDIERFLAGSGHDSSSIRIFSRQGTSPSDSIKLALVRFLSPTAAMSAMITKNRGFCLNNQVTIQVLQ